MAMGQKLQRQFGQRQLSQFEIQTVQQKVRRQITGFNFCIESYPVLASSQQVSATAAVPFIF